MVIIFEVCGMYEMQYINIFYVESLVHFLYNNKNIKVFWSIRKCCRCVANAKKI